MSSTSVTPVAWASVAARPRPLPTASGIALRRATATALAIDALDAAIAGLGLDLRACR